MLFVTEPSTCHWSEGCRRKPQPVAQSMGTGLWLVSWAISPKTSDSCWEQNTSRQHNVKRESKTGFIKRIYSDKGAMLPQTKNQIKSQSERFSWHQVGMSSSWHRIAWFKPIPANSRIFWSFYNQTELDACRLTCETSWNLRFISLLTSKSHH